MKYLLIRGNFFVPGKQQLKYALPLVCKQTQACPSDCQMRKIYLTENEIVCNFFSMEMEELSLKILRLKRRQQLKAYKSPSMVFQAGGINI